MISWEKYCIDFSWKIFDGKLILIKKHMDSDLVKVKLI